MKISLQKLTQTATERPDGYLAEYLALGTVHGDWLYLKPAAHKTMLAKYAPERLKPPGPTSTITPQPSTKLTGLGDVVAMISKPIARAIDKVAGTDLENCKPCDKRQDKLNAAVPFKRSKKHDKA